MKEASLKRLHVTLILAAVLAVSLVTSLDVANTPPVEGAENSWTTMADMPTPRLGSGVAVVNGKIYAIGGRMSGGYLSTNEEYDPQTS